MKIIISENKVFNSIYNYIGTYLNDIDINSINTYNWDETDEYGDAVIDYNALVFFEGEWAGEDYTEILFNYYNEDYYDDSPGSFKDLAPILDVMYDLAEHLDTMFGDYWKEPMKKWFEDNYNLPVKTISTHY